MNLDSIPELPEIPELKYEAMGEMKGSQQASQSPNEEEENRGPLGRVTMEEFMKNPNEDGGRGGYGHDQWGHMQGGFPALLCPQQIWIPQLKPNHHLLVKS